MQQQSREKDWLCHDIDRCVINFFLWFAWFDFDFCLVNIPLHCFTSKIDPIWCTYRLWCTVYIGLAFTVFFLLLLLELVPTTPRLRNTRFVYFEHYERMKVCQWKKIAWEQETLLYCEWARFSTREMIESIQSLRFRLFFFHLICAL